LDEVFTITSDNASANGSTIDILKDDFELKGSLPIWGAFVSLMLCSYYNFVGASRVCRNRGHNRFC
jgi:hypothetical protein